MRKFTIMFKDVDECREGTSECQPPAERCVNIAGTYRCEPISLPTTTRATTTKATTTLRPTTTTTTTTTTPRPTTTTSTTTRPTTTNTQARVTTTAAALTTASTTLTTTTKPNFSTISSRPGGSNQNDRCPAGYRYSRRTRNCQGIKQSLPNQNHFQHALICTSKIEMCKRL